MLGRLAEVIVGLHVQVLTRAFPRARPFQKLLNLQQERRYGMVPGDNLCDCLHQHQQSCAIVIAPCCIYVEFGR